MVASIATYQFTETGVRLRIDDETATLDVSGDPEHPNPIRVAELNISYRTTTTRTGESVEMATEITNITYLLDHADYQVAYVHPDHLQQSQEWPDWVAELVDQHRPTEGVR
ncbi:hypothetical protein [Streptomyces sp. NPDC048445]|uniref:hypothetical protein n=1 Tax=Streptomyces sp. NPDC048445 TaxID=3365553 RepID=UPI0037126F3D